MRKVIACAGECQSVEAHANLIFESLTRVFPLVHCWRQHDFRTMLHGRVAGRWLTYRSHSSSRGSDDPTGDG